MTPEPASPTRLSALPSREGDEDEVRSLCPDQAFGFLCLFNGLFVLACRDAQSGAVPAELHVNGHRVSGALLTIEHGGARFCVGVAPDSLRRDNEVVAELTLASGGQRETLRFADRPLPVTRGVEALATALAALAPGSRAAAIKLIVKAGAKLGRKADDGFSATLRRLVESFGTTVAVSAVWLTDRLLYCRGAGTPGARARPGRLVNADCILLTSGAPCQLACGKMFIEADGTVHAVVADLPAERQCHLVIGVDDRLLNVVVRPQTVEDPLTLVRRLWDARPDTADALNRFLIRRCAEVYRRREDARLKALGNLLWAQLAFPQQTVTRPELPFGCAIEHLLPIRGAGVLIAGWLWDPDELLDGLLLDDGKGGLTEISATLHRFQRPGAEHAVADTPRRPPGLIAFVPLRAADDLWPTYRVVGRLKGGTRIDLGTDLNRSHRTLTTPEALLALIAGGGLDAAALRDIAPAIAALQSRRASFWRAPRIVDFLSRIEAPVVSIVVPIYRRLDHARHQLAHFAADPAFASTELIYVLDSKEQESEFAQLLDGCCRLYRRPTTLVVLAENRGFAGATNAGAQVARGRYLVLLNSDVIPDRPGWLAAMQGVLDSDAAVGAVGARLLYEDGSVQHQGMAYARDSAGLWRIVHPGKGLCVDRGSGPVPALTAACMMLRLDDYRAVGGLSEDYVIGDFEDSDLCHKLRAAGKSLWFCAEATLYHLERQSMGAHKRLASSTWRYNQLLHHQRWADAITAAAVEADTERTPIDLPAITTIDCDPEAPERPRTPTADRDRSARMRVAAAAILVALAAVYATKQLWSQAGATAVPPSFAVRPMPAADDRLQPAEEPATRAEPEETAVAAASREEIADLRHQINALTDRLGDLESTLAQRLAALEVDARYRRHRPAGAGAAARGSSEDALPSVHRPAPRPSSNSEMVTPPPAGSLRSRPLVVPPE